MNKLELNADQVPPLNWDFSVLDSDHLDTKLSKSFILGQKSICPARHFVFFNPWMTLVQVCEDLISHYK